MAREPLDADKARNLANTSAEKNRQSSKVAAAYAAGELAMRAEQRAAKIRETADAKIIKFEAVIAAQANKAKKSAIMTYSERISASRNSRKEVADIEHFAEEVAELIFDEFTERGFAVMVNTEEVRDFRDDINAQPEYFDTHIVAKW